MAYWHIFAGSLKAQNVLILVASYIFYGWWDYRFLLLIMASTVVDFIAARKIHISTSNNSRLGWVWVSITFNLVVLGFFKYYNFFLDSLNSLLVSVGTSVDFLRLDIVLPVGISFYTFQTMSYTLDVYKKDLEPTNDLVSFAAFVSFFPQLVAGPIERAKNLLPQLVRQRAFDYGLAVSGMRLILFGLFKKVVIADPLSSKVDLIFSDYSGLSSADLALGT
ncbi:MAG: MBOAT family protein, partial [Imperialibacter sp.]